MANIAYLYTCEVVLGGPCRGCPLSRLGGIFLSCPHLLGLISGRYCTLWIRVRALADRPHFSYSLSVGSLFGARLRSWGCAPPSSTWETRSGGWPPASPSSSTNRGGHHPAKPSPAQFSRTRLNKPTFNPSQDCPWPAKPNEAQAKHRPKPRDFGSKQAQ